MRSNPFDADALTTARAGITQAVGRLIRRAAQEQSQRE
jgi:Rad3-related DNA helicase